MPKAIDWTEQMNETIRLMRAAGELWEDIAKALCVGINSLKQHANDHLGYPKKRRIKAPPPGPMIERSSREPLPAGHPIAWTILNAGTCNEGARYPHPVRMDLQQSRISSNSRGGIALRGAGA